MKNNMKRHVCFPFSAMLRAFLLVLMSISIASAQTAGPKGQPNRSTQDRPFYTTKRVAANEKAGPASTKAPSSVSQPFEKEGVRVDFSIKSTPGADEKDSGLVAGANATATLRISDARTGQPLTGLRPNAWINRRSTEHAPNEAECKDMIRTFLGGLLSVRPTVDLNSYLMLTLNHDNTIAVINPQVSFSITKLENVIVLPGTGADWALANSKDFLYVTVPEKSVVAVINTITRKVVSTLPTGEKTRPMRIALQPDGRYVWVGLDGASQVVAIDTTTNKVAATVAVGAGLHNIGFTADGRFAYVTNSSADSVSAIDTRTLTKVADIAVGKTPVPVAYSRASGFIYVAAINGATISVINPAKQQVVAQIPARRGVVALRFDPEGRYGFVVNQVESQVSIFDAATNAVIGTSEVVKGPDQVAFTASYAYIRGTGSEKFSLIELSDVKKGKVAPINIQAGQKSPSDMPEEIGVADMIAPTPEGNSVMIANASDQMIYYYVEGMMAPMGTFENYKRRARALMLIDRSLSEVAPGTYSLPIRLTRAGHFDVPVLIDQPRIINCFQLDVADSPNGEKDKPAVSIAVEPLFKEQRFKPGEPVTLRFKITDSATQRPLTGLQDVHIVAVEPPGIWQQRQWAREVSNGVYEVTQIFPREAIYRVMTSVMSRGVRFADLKFTPVPVSNEAAAADKKSEPETRNPK